MADTAKRLYGPNTLTTSAATLYTVPAATTAIVRNIHVVGSSGTTLTLLLGIGGVAIGNCLFYNTPVPGAGVLDWSGFLVLTAAETIQAQASSATSVTVTISGIEVS
jgi:hypothetical protein